MENLKKEKAKTQPSKIKTGGSTFKNPINQTNEKVWELIRASVPNDISFGDAVISEKHSNFFVNKNHEKYQDMKSLVDYVNNITNNKMKLIIIYLDKK